MKKTLLSVIAGLTVINAASAIPSPGDRRKLCESKPFDFVWVEKTQTCVPINPCRTSNDKIRDAYCINAGGVVDTNTAEEAMRRYAKNIMKVGVDSIKVIDSGYRPFLSMRTTDGGYYVFGFDGPDTGDKIRGQLELACWSYGKQLHYDWQDKDSPKYGCLGVNSQKECDDMADFASLLSGDLVEGEIEQLGQSVCWLTNFDGWHERRENLQDGVIYNNSYQSPGATIATGVSK